MITMARMASLLILFCAALAGYAGETRLYRCIDDRGKPSFQSYRCIHSGEQLTIRTLYHGWTGLRPGEKALLAEYRARDERLRRKKAAASRRAQRKTTRVESTSCFNKRKGLRKVNTRLRRGYAADQGAELRARRDDYEEYLRTYCRGS